MIPVNKEYPVFEANQVLTATHLNALENYLDEQNRLTRAALHGIGVVCGLEVSTDNKTKLTISKGYGITSEGYPGIVGSDDFVADKYKKFTVIDSNPLFWNEDKRKNKYELWELLDAGHDDYKNGVALTTDILNNNVVLLFVELLEKDLKNCSATSCDDLGLKVQVNTRMLLISETDLKTLNDEITENTRQENATGDLFPNLTARLGLPDIQLPRLDVPASNMVDGPTLFDAYRKILTAPRTLPVKGRPFLTTIGETLKTESLFTTVGKGLDACHEAFQPILPALRETFVSKLARIEEIYTGNLANSGVIYSQYFYDFLGDLIEAYDEFRWKAAEFMTLCNPPQTLFPRHLELGETGSGNFAGHKVHRHYFRPSPALSEKKKSGEEVQQLFERLRLLVDQFKAPSLPVKGTIDASVKITPSRLGDVSLSDKAIPFYYTLSDGLKNAWNFTKTSRGRANQNTGYHADRDHDPLLFNIDRYNFFRIEGHIGLDWRETVKNLLDKIRKYRLPIDVVALNAHPATATAAVLADPLVAHCITDDLEIIYDAWSQELSCLMREQVGKLTDFTLSIAKANGGAIVEKTSSSARKTVAAGKAAVRKIDLSSAIVIEENTFGKVYANTLKAKAETPSVDLKQTFDTLLLIEKKEFGTVSMQEYNTVIGNRVNVIASMMDFADALPARASDMNYAGISKKYETLQDAISKYRDDIRDYDTAKENAIITEAQKQALLNDLETLLGNCLMNRLEALEKELKKRKKEVDELIFFSKYLQKHPGIAHKAGAPAGGTFILIFQEIPTGSKSYPIRQETKYTIPERVVIADFFLPYRCGSDCPSVQFVMPAARPKFTMQQECPNVDGFAWVNLDFSYRVPPCEVKIDNSAYEPLVDDRILLKVGEHMVTVMDAEGGVSLVQSIQVRPRFTVVTGTPAYDVESKTATVQLTIANAQLPITIDGVENEATEQAANLHTIIVSYEKTGTIRVGDASPCPAQEVRLCIPVIFTTSQECPDNEGNAMVHFDVKHGEAPFMVQIDDKEYVSLIDNKMNLPVGSHQLIVRDANGCVSAAQTIVIVPRFTVQAEEPVCDKANETYTVKLLLSNPRLPITIDGKNVDSTVDDAQRHSVIAGPFKSGETVTVEVGDSSGCPARKLTFSHTCCDLPCKGMALRRGYRFPLPDPSPDLVLDVDFWIEYPASEKIVLSNEVKEIILKGNDVVDQINTLIDKKTGIPGWLSLQKARTSDMIAEVPTWWIEYFECLELKFGFNLKWTHKAATRLSGSVEVSINPARSIITINSSNEPVRKVLIPAFDGIAIDKCHPDSPQEPLCKEPDLRLVTSAIPEGNTVKLAVTMEGIDEAASVLWEVPESIEKMANGERVTFSFSAISNEKEQYRVTAFTKNGCRVTKAGSFAFKPIR
jgi:hypothetical protein